jgi:glycosyltransferase involved in cell wall biosynthesis
MRVLHIITDLGLGGAAVMLHRLLQASALEDCLHEVVSLTDLGVIAGRLQQLGIRTHALRMSRLPNPMKVLRLANLIKKIRPAVVQGWMYHSNLLGGIAAKMAGETRIVWGIHSSRLDPAATHRTTLWIDALCARLSHRIPDRIVAVSRVSRDQHVAAGYDAEKFVVLPNGFDLEQYQPDLASRREVRKELDLDQATVLIGLVARMHPVKDHLNFVRAAAQLAKRQPHVCFLLCGEGTAPDNKELLGAITEAGLLSRFRLLGRRDDVARIMNSLDIGTLCSAFGEAFPLVIGEAMACGVPCVVTDLGDCAYLVGETGRVVPPRDSEALARAWEELVLLGPDGRRRLGLEARHRIEAHFSLSRIAGDYAALYRSVLGNGAAHDLASSRAQCE